MGSKLVLLIGLLVGVFLTFMCVNENKTALSLKYNQIAENDATLQTIVPATSVETVQDVEKPTPTPPPVVELNEPIFSYSIKDTTKLSAKFSSIDKTPALEEFILAYCPTDSCTQDLSFDENTKDAKWQKNALKIAAFLKDKNIKNGVISIGDNLFNLKGELKNKEDMDELNELLTAFDPEIYKMENLTTIVTEKVKEPIVEKTQDKINELLKLNPIYFKFNSNNLTKNSQAILDKIITTLKASNETEIRVEGHTDSGGKKVYNKALSQKRADMVQKYLLNHGLQNIKIKSIGYGEERPISSNPKEEINRRVEIHLMRGE